MDDLQCRQGGSPRHTAQMIPRTTLSHGGNSPGSSPGWRIGSQTSSSNTPTDHTQEYYPHTVYIAFHPVQGEVWVDAITGKVYTSAREKVPQLPYRCGNTQKSWQRKSSILFSTWGHPGVRLSEVCNGDFDGIDERDSSPFLGNFRGISIRIHLPGYPSSTEVERRLKELTGTSRTAKGEKLRARSMQVSTQNYRAKAESVTKAKLAQEVSKRIRWHIQDLMDNTDLFPFDGSVEGKWRLGEGLMQFDYMTIIALENVSSGSWSPVLHVDKCLHD